MSLTVPGKILIGIVATVLTAVVVLGVGGWYWWKRNSNELLEAGRSAMLEGRTSGTRLGESACVVQALETHKADANLSIVSSVRNGLWLSGCLATSKVEADFCDGVPSQEETIARGLWAGATCAYHELADPYCPTLIQNVAKYCSSPTRAEKGTTHASNQANSSSLNPARLRAASLNGG